MLLGEGEQLREEMKVCLPHRENPKVYFFLLVYIQPLYYCIIISPLSFTFTFTEVIHFCDFSFFFLFLKIEESVTEAFFGNFLVSQIDRLEGYLSSNQWMPSFVSTSKPLVGELYLFAMIHQVVLVKTPKSLSKHGSAPKVRAWYVATLTDYITQRVLTGGSAFGVIARSYVDKGAEL